MSQSDQGKQSTLLYFYVRRYVTVCRLSLMEWMIVCNDTKYLGLTTVGSNMSLVARIMELVVPGEMQCSQWERIASYL